MLEAADVCQINFVDEVRVARAKKKHEAGGLAVIANGLRLLKK